MTSRDSLGARRNEDQSDVGAIRDKISSALLMLAACSAGVGAYSIVLRAADAPARVTYNAVANEPHEIAGAMPEGKPEVSARDVALALAEVTAGSPLDLSGRSLRYLDLAGLGLTQAKFRGADLWGIDLTDSDLSGADLSWSRLNRSSLTRAKFHGANLEGATVLRPTIHTSFQFDWKDAPNFDRANLTRARFFGKLDGASFRAAEAPGADFSSYEPRAGQGTLATRRGTDLIGCDFSGARLEGANFTTAILEFAKFRGADLRGARLAGAALAMVDFTGADLTGADFTGADVYNAVLTGARGLETVTGLADAVNADKVMRQPD